MTGGKQGDQERRIKASYKAPTSDHGGTGEGSGS